MRHARLSSTLLVLPLALPFIVGPDVSVAAEKETVRDRLWIWGHPAGVYNESFLAEHPRKSTIEPVAVAESMGLENMIFVRYDGRPEPPFGDDYRPFGKLERVYWSLVGAGGATSAAEREAVYRLAERHENITGFILDDFFRGHVTGLPPGEQTEDDKTEPFKASLTPQQLRELRERKVRGRRLPVMVVVYTGQISPRARAHLAEVEEVCLWTWRPENLGHLKANLTALEKLIPGKPIYLGCSMYDFAARRPLPVERMKHQTELGHRWLREGRIQGLIFPASANVDVGLEAVDWTHDWIQRVGDQPLPMPQDSP